MKVHNITDVLPSPDGSTVVWTESVAVMNAEKSEMNTQLFFAHSDGSHRLAVNARREERQGRGIFSGWRLCLFHFGSERKTQCFPSSGGWR